MAAKILEICVQNLELNGLKFEKVGNEIKIIIEKLFGGQ